MIGVVDYEAGNIASISHALSTIGTEFTVSNDTQALGQCSGIILPGVGAATGAMRLLGEHKLVDFLRGVHTPLLGICLGMQLFYDKSEEGSTTCLGVVPGTVRRFDERTKKIPHMGWNNVVQQRTAPLLAGIPTSSHFYFAHSYYAPVAGSTVAVTEEGVQFSSVIVHRNFMGVQFHPEKSGPVGLQLLRNFAGLCT